MSRFGPLRNSNLDLCPQFVRSPTPSAVLGKLGLNVVCTVKTCCKGWWACWIVDPANSRPSGSLAGHGGVGGGGGGRTSPSWDWSWCWGGLSVLVCLSQEGGFSQHCIPGPPLPAVPARSTCIHIWCFASVSPPTLPKVSAKVLHDLYHLPSRYSIWGQRIIQLFLKKKKKKDS